MLPIVTKNREETQDPSDLFVKVQFSIDKPSNKIQGKDYHWNEIQYKFEVENDPVNLSYHQMDEEK